MLNKALLKQTLVAILLASPAAGDPPHGRGGRFGDWRVDCTVAPVCASLTSIANAEGTEVLRLTFTSGAAPALAVATPLPLHLPDGLALALGQRPDRMVERMVAWRTCGALGCEATLPIEPALLEALRRERAGTAGFTLVQGERVRVPFSLMGFSAAARALDAVSP